MVRKPIALPIRFILLVSGHGASQGAARPPRPTLFRESNLLGTPIFLRSKAEFREVAFQAPLTHLPLSGATVRSRLLTSGRLSPARRRKKSGSSAGVGSLVPAGFGRVAKARRGVPGLCLRR